MGEERLEAAFGRLALFLGDPRQDWRVMAEAGLDLDPAFLPLLAVLGAGGSARVLALGARLGRDHSTISRQLARLEAAGLLRRGVSDEDRRARTVRLTQEGLGALAALSAARRRLLDTLLETWSEKDRTSLARLLTRLAAALPEADGDEQDDRLGRSPRSRL